MGEEVACESSQLPTWRIRTQVLAGAGESSQLTADCISSQILALTQGLPLATAYLLASQRRRVLLGETCMKDSWDGAVLLQLLVDVIACCCDYC